MINPCGGCNVKWISEDNGQALDCNSGLSKCHKNMQVIMNSRAWINQGFSAATLDKDEIEDLSESEEASPSYSVGNTLREMILNNEEVLPFSGLGRTMIPPPRPAVANTRMSTKVTPIFADFGGHRVMGIMSSTVTIMGGGSDGSSSSEERSEEENNARKRLTPVKSIADILADMMTSQSQYPTGGSRSGRTYNAFDDLIDLMPSSSQIYPVPVRGLMPPPPIVQHEYAYPSSQMPVARVRRGTL
jgi:hypothetical protein